MKAAKSKPVISAAAPGGLFFAGLLAVLLVVLFWKSFLPGYVHFSNDGPLGQQMTEQMRLPDAFTGAWADLSNIGGNAGSPSPDIVSLIRWALGPVGFAKFLAPCALFILGLGAWAFFRQLKLSPLAAVLGALAAALNSAFFSTACWGVASQQIAVGFSYFALALVVSNTPETPGLTRWVRWLLAGLAVGVNVMQGADIGAIFSVFIAAFILFRTLIEESGPVIVKAVRSVGRIAVVAVFAGFMAMQTIQSLVGAAIVGVAGAGQDTESKAARWDWATQWSMPKMETLCFVVPGLFGYRMDTPKNMLGTMQESYKGGEYWGGIGRSPEIDRFFDKVFQRGDAVKVDFPENPSQSVVLTIGQDGNVNLPVLGPFAAAGISGFKLKQSVDKLYSDRGINAAIESPPGMMRFSGGGGYCGVLVVLVAFWAVAQSWRRQDSVFTVTQRQLLWFWTAILFFSLLLSFGRFAPFYKLFYMLPYASTMRNPCKFAEIFSWAFVVVFAYGIHGLSRRYLEVPAGISAGIFAQLKNWWVKIRGFDRLWTLGCAGAIAASVLGWLVYSSQKSNLVKYLQMTGPFAVKPEDIAAFSISQVGWFVLLLVLAVGLFTMVIAGVFSGKRAKLGGILMGVLLVADLGLANLPWVIHWDYTQKYEVGSLNPTVALLRDKPYEHRVAYALPYPLSTPSQFQVFDQLYKIEWVQHHFLYYNIQCLDDIQNPRPPADLAAFGNALQPSLLQDSAGRVMLNPDTLYLIGRKWQLTNTRYLLGPAAVTDVLNQQFDPGQQRFRIIQRFGISLKPGVGEFHQHLEELTVVPAENGDYALFDFTGALPRAKLYSHWQVSTNDTDTLKTLADKNFDPQQTVLVSTPLSAEPSTNQILGTVEFKSYTPKKIIFDTKATTPTVLLLNDKFDPQWRALVDGKPAPIFRANYIMRGIYLTPGSHTVEFHFSLPHRPLYISLTAIGLGILLSGFLIYLTRKPTPAPNTK